jgi:hypothetical protein
VVLEEKSRIERTLPRLEEVCRGLEQHGVEITVIKTLDHWPDFGRDIDVFTLAKEDRLLTAMIQEFGAELLDRSWGDRLAGKYSFAVPGLGRTLEVHVGRLGQVGEQKAVARKIQNNREPWIFNDRCFYVPAPEEQILAATLQRMYRHFFFRLSDIVNTERLVTGNRVDVESLMETARSGGIWEGTQAYLRLVNEYAEYYRSCEIPPRFKLGLRARGNFLRLAVFPQGAVLYGRELLNLLGRGELASGLRLTLLPPLACAAGISFKMTGSNQGIW